MNFLQTPAGLYPNGLMARAVSWATPEQLRYLDTILADMGDGITQALQAGGDMRRLLNNGGAMVTGQAVYVTGNDTMGLARADVAATAEAIGIVTDGNIATNTVGNIQIGGIFSASTTAWDVVTGQVGGLTAGSIYYLSSVTAGSLTTAPAAIRKVIGISISTTEMLLLPGVQSSASWRLPYRVITAVSGSTSITAADNMGIIDVDAGGSTGTVTLTLPTATAASQGMEFNIYKWDGTANRVTVQAATGQALYGTATATHQGECITVRGRQNNSWLAEVTGALSSQSIAGFSGPDFGQGLNPNNTPTFAGEILASGGLTRDAKSKTANYQATTQDDIVFVDASAGAVTVTLPAASASTIGREFSVYKIDASANAVTVAGAGANVVNGIASTIVQWKEIQVIGYTATSWIGGVV